MRQIRMSLAIALLCVGGASAQTNSSAITPENDLAQAREKVRAAEAAHPGNSIEVIQAIDNLVSKQLDAQLTDAETLTLVTREAEMAKATTGPASKPYVNALGMISEVYVGLSRPAEGRPFAEQGLAIAEQAFPGTEEYADAADEVAYVCNLLGDYAAALHAEETAIAANRKAGGSDNWNLVGELTNLADIKIRMHDTARAQAASEESLAIALRVKPDDPHLGVIENNLGSLYVQTEQFDKAIPHLNRALEINTKVYGPLSPLVRNTESNLGNLYSRTGQFELAWKNYEVAANNPSAPVDSQAHDHALFARSLASGGDLKRAISEGLLAERMGRESFELQARVLPERQALAYAAQRPGGLSTALSVLLRHPELPAGDIYQEMVRSRALVADEMARRERNLNASNDPKVANLLADLDQARSELLAVGRAAPAGENHADAVARATARMEQIERALAERSAAVRDDERIDSAQLEDLRQRLPAHSVLISYVAYGRRAVGVVDPSHHAILSYMAFVLHPDSQQLHFFDLGDGKTINDLVARARASADAEAHGGGLGSRRNERNYREAAESLRKLVWDPLSGELRGATLALVVPDGILNLIPFSALPEGNGYLVEHGPAIHLLSSERDLIAPETETKKTGLLAVGSPQFELSGIAADPSEKRGSSESCDGFRSLEFGSLPGTLAEVNDISNSWRHWNNGEPEALLTGADATRVRFLQEASQHRVLHVATHAFLLDSSCGNGNPLLQSGLVFAGVDKDRDDAVVTAQQIASLDLSGVDWAVLSACNTGNGVLRGGEGILGLQRAFRVAGARSVVMTLWPVDDDVTRRFMHDLYAERLEAHATTADAVWDSARKLLLERRAAGKSTHPWYWAGFVGSGAWE